MHDETALHAHGAPVARIDPLHLRGYEAVRYVSQSRAAVFLGHRRTQESHAPHLLHVVVIERHLVAVGREYLRLQLGPAERGRGITYRDLLGGEEGVDAHGIEIVEASLAEGSVLVRGRRRGRRRRRRRRLRGGDVVIVVVDGGSRRREETSRDEQRGGR